MMTPVDRSSEGVLTRNRRPHSASEETEAVIESRGDLLRSEHSYPRCRQLDGQGNAIETPANLRDRPGIVRGQRETRHRVAGALDEQLHRVGRCDPGERFAVD